MTKNSTPTQSKEPSQRAATCRLVQQAKASEVQTMKNDVSAVVKRKAGQPTKFTQEKWEAILDCVASYGDLVELCSDPSMPAVSTIGRWMRADPKLKEDMRVAWELFSYVGYSVNNNVLRGGILSTGDKARDFEIVANNRWHMGKTNRRDFGDKTQLEVTLPQPVVLDAEIIYGEGGDGV